MTKTGNARRSKKGKESATTSTRMQEEEEETVTSSFPWPRPDNTPFIREANGLEWKCHLIPHTTMREMQRTTSYQMYKHGDAWTHHHCTFYNGLLRVEMAPTRFLSTGPLVRMGIMGDVRMMLERLSVDRISYLTQPLYPELARQFFASAELRYDDGAFPAASEGHLSYFSSGILYDISIRELCDVYGFDRTAESCRFPDDFPQAAELWNVIGSGGYESRGAKLTHIRNPAVRVVAKILGNILFAKEESGALRHDELMLLHFGLPSFVRDIYTSPPPSTLRTNLGAIFAANLVSKKARGLRTTNSKVERIGSLLTPLFRHHDIDLRSTPCIPQIAYFDEQYFRNSGILKPGFVYQFQDRSGVLQYCKLPLQEFTALTSRANLEFTVPPEHLRPTPATSRRRGSSSRPTSSQPHMEDDRVPDSYPSHSRSTETFLPPHLGQYELHPLSADATDAEYRAWTVDALRKNSSMMHRIWDALTQMRCPPPPFCFRAPQTTDAPDVAGHRTSAADDGDDISDSDTRLSRRRRAPGQSQSASSDER